MFKKPIISISIFFALLSGYAYSDSGYAIEKFVVSNKTSCKLLYGNPYAPTILKPYDEATVQISSGVGGWTQSFAPDPSCHWNQYSSIQMGDNTVSSSSMPKNIQVSLFYVISFSPAKEGKQTITNQSFTLPKSPTGMAEIDIIESTNS